jgi:Cu(I)/Ag(I) efflux system membrane fusion protein
MNKYLLITLLPLLLFAESQMKCEAGKCSTGKEMPQKVVPEKKAINTMNASKDEAMKCESGKCSEGKEIPNKDIPKNDSTHTSPSIKKTHNNATIEQLFNVKTVHVKEMNTAKKQINYGYVVAQDSKKVDVTAWYSGFVQELYADTMYKKVKKGDPLVKVYSPEVYKAKQDYLNTLNFSAARSTPGILQSAKTKLLLLGVDEKEIKKIHLEKKAGEFTTIYAPIDGWIFEKNINQGSSFNSKKKLFQIVNLVNVWVEVKLFQEELQKLHTLHHFTVKTKGIDKVYEAKKSILYPMLNPKEATATLRLEVDNNDEALMPGMYTKVYASAKSKTRLVIPRTAVMRKNGIWYAFLATEFKGEYEPIKVEINPLDNKHYEVIKGLNSGDELVNNALFMMDSDAQINSIY